MENNPSEMERQLDRWFSQYSHIMVAFSGGIDSTLLTYVTLAAYKKGTIQNLSVVHSYSPTETQDELNAVLALAKLYDFPLTILETNELNDERFIQNNVKRCYWCKTIKFSALLEFAQQTQLPWTLIEGSNADDSKEYRPGKLALNELNIKSPMAELGFSKENIRYLAGFYKIPNAQKPSNPCLATRITYGIKICSDRLQRIGNAESFLHDKGFPILRVRMDEDSLARIEVPLDDLKRFLEEPLRSQIIERFRELGFTRISLDLEGFVPGKADRLLHLSPV